MSISHRGVARGLERLIWLKYYVLLKRQITFNLGLNADKIPIIRENVQIKIVQNSISYKKLSGCIFIFPRSGSRGLEFVFK